jgi:hypothetical protein
VTAGRPSTDGRSQRSCCWLLLSQSVMDVGRLIQAANPKLCVRQTTKQPL